MQRKGCSIFLSFHKNKTTALYACVPNIVELAYVFCGQQLPPAVCVITVGRSLEHFAACAEHTDVTVSSHTYLQLPTVCVSKC